MELLHYPAYLFLTVSLSAVYSCTHDKPTYHLAVPYGGRNSCSRLVNGHSFRMAAWSLRDQSLISCNGGDADGLDMAQCISDKTLHGDLVDI